VWERRMVDFALLVSRHWAWARATREPSRDRKWPIPRPQHVHALQYTSYGKMTRNSVIMGIHDYDTLSNLES